MINYQQQTELLELAKKVHEEHSKTITTHFPQDFIDYPHLFLLGCIMDRQIPYEKAWGIPIKVANELGSKSFDSFASKDEQYSINLFEKNNYHRFNKIMGECFYLAVQKIKLDYNGDARNIWNDEPTSTELIKRLKEFKGVGDSIASMTVNILDRRYKIKLKDRRGLNISSDRNVNRVFYRMGLTPKISQTETIKAARLISPDFPGQLDKLFWKVGREYCQENWMKCNICIVNGYCKKNNS